MILPEATITRLLSSIEAGRLVLLCGAGLSMPSPSNLMSAATVAATCYDRYTPIQDLPADLRNDVAALAAHFYGQSHAVFESVFIGTLVPWNDLVGEPNPGHAAIGDLLVCRALQSALSANFDNLIEQCANRLKIAMRGALDGQEAAEYAKEVSPLVKFYGCLDRNREKTTLDNASAGRGSHSKKS